MTTKKVYFYFLVKQKNGKFFVFLFYLNAISCVLLSWLVKIFNKEKILRWRIFIVGTSDFRWAVG